MQALHQTFRRAARPGFAIALALATGASAVAARELDAELRQTVIASCGADAYRLCPQSLGSEKDAVSCMRSKRAQLNQVCRVAYDKVVRVLRQ